MARSSRIKQEYGKYHIMIRSISDLLLFRDDDDKNLFMSIIKHYQKIYLFKVYAYCLMDNHAHLIIDSNGADISTIMHCINFRYVQKYNKKYNRHGHLLQDRFKSKLINSERYLYTLSAYIHNNPLAIQKFKHNPEKYVYSSLGVYIGLRKDPYKILDESFIMQMFSHNVKKARHRYIKFVFKCNDIKFMEEEAELSNDKTEYRSESTLLVRNFKEDDIIEFVCNKTNVNRIKLHIKHNKSALKARALTVVLMRCFCNYRCKDICKVLGNVTQSSVSNLCNTGVSLIDTDEKYRNIVKDFLVQYATV